MDESATASGEPSVQEHLLAAYSRAKRGRDEAQLLLEAGFPSPSLVWSVRSAEVLLRDFVLAPYFIDRGTDWATAMKKASRVLGNSDWKNAFTKAEEWYGPFDEPLTENGSNAWAYWQSVTVRRRGDIVHGKPFPDATTEEAAQALAFAERMATWYAQRFVTSPRHPLGQQVRQLIDQVGTALRGESHD
ncbi:hypothetical protein [Jiangella alkaliphila]|uniref:hypothetical protein n=1 Tax=Jiangella alkaliphila TaxID=419479 RepID=UPI00128AF12F|nr:hypothetical protein [Jiangella alkaliphila]